jgi:hypothetical protein
MGHHVSKNKIEDIPRVIVNVEPRLTILKESYDVKTTPIRATESSKQLGYIDFYGYDKEKFPKLLEDFIACILEYNPILDTSVIEYTSFGRCEKRILASGNYSKFQITVEEKMYNMGYAKYRDYNYYLFSL